jgi:iron complex transport system substrate-binding protein
MQRRIFLTVLAASAFTACAPLPPAGTAKTVDININGKTVTVPFKPQRVAVFDPASVDTLDALGVQVAGLSTMALPKHLAYYADAKYIKVGTLFEPDTAALTALKPDLIIVSGRSRAKAEELAKFAPTIDLSADTAQFEKSVFHNWETLGKIFDRQDKAQQLIQNTQKKISAIKPYAANQGTAMQVMTIQDRVAAFAPQSRFGFIYDVIGFKAAPIPPSTPAKPGPVAEGAKAPRPVPPTQEALAASNPDWIFTFDRGAIGNPDKAAPAFKSRPAFANTNAVRNNKVIVTDEVNWYIYGNGGYGTLNSTLNEIAAALNVK